MIYPKDNRFILSSNPHSLGLQNDMQNGPTATGPGGLVGMVNQKLHIGSGALLQQCNPPKHLSWGGKMSIWR